MRKQEAFVLLFSTVVLLFVGINVFASNSSGDIQSNIDEAESRIRERESQYQEVNDKLSSLNNSKEDLSDYMKLLKDSYNAMVSLIDGINDEIKEKEIQIAAIDEQLIKAEELANEQYEAMKLRICYMYENGQNSYIEALLSSDTLDNILNRIEYMSELLEYDRNKLKEYEELMVYVKASKDNIEKEKQDLEVLLVEQENQKSELASVMAGAAIDIGNMESQIDAAEAEAESYAKAIDDEKNSINELKAEESRRIEESIRQSKEIESKKNAGIYEESTTVGNYDASNDEVMMMAAIMYCEARGEPYQGILAVGSVVMNRVADSRFPNTIEGVIMASGQFSPVASGLYAIALAKGANETCIQAAKEVLYDGVRIGPWLYFRTINNIIQGTNIGNHVFYYR